MKKKYDIIVVGAGHAGCEASSISATMGSKVLLITQDLNRIAQMSCNPAIGGIAKGQIVREIDALGGVTGIVTDKTTLQFRMLNKSKGPAVWSPRAQCDRRKFSEEWRLVLEKSKNIDLWQDSVVHLEIKNNKICGVKTKLGMTFSCDSVILTTGTFLNGTIHIGATRIEGGRISELASYNISEQLKEYGFQVGRMKTGTPPRLDGRTINFLELQEQKDENSGQFSYLNTTNTLNKMSCFITYTNSKVHEILKEEFSKSPLFDGRIKGIGPRYCPSIETKIDLFAEKDKHQIFLEPEGENTYEYYMNGFSTSLPIETQIKSIQQIKGLEKTQIIKPGYAIEYDFFQPTQLYSTLETKYIENLFFAGQINGTTGYEEAAGQGLIAGINAHLKKRDQAPLILKRSQAYIGVLIDDLVTKGTNEPYRMFTSRAEYRMLLRQDNADERLTPLVLNYNCINEKRKEIFSNKIKNRDKLLEYIKNHTMVPEEINPKLLKLKSAPIKQKIKMVSLILRPEINIENLIDDVDPYIKTLNIDKDLREEIIVSCNIKIKYKGYIEREEQVVGKTKRLEHILLKEDIDYSKFHNISTESRQKLSKIKPSTIGQASRIPGVSPSDINVILLQMRK